MKEIVLGVDKYATAHLGAVLIVHGHNAVNLVPTEVDKLKRFLNEAT